MRAKKAQRFIQRQSKRCDLAQTVWNDSLEAENVPFFYQLDCEILKTKMCILDSFFKGLLEQAQVLLKTEKK